MASEVEKFDTIAAISQSYLSNLSTNKLVKGENNTAISKVLPAPVELDELQRDISELCHILHVAERSSVKEIIQADIQLILVKIESIEDLNKNQLETNISWTRAATLKHNKSRYKKEKISDPLHLTSNFYSPLDNEAECEDNLVSKKCSVSERKPVVNSVRKSRTNNYKKKNCNCNKKKDINSSHKVLIIGNSHARGCATTVKAKLNSDYEVVGFVHPGSTMKVIKDVAKEKIDQLTKEDIVVLWGGGSNDVAKNNSGQGAELTRAIIISASHTNVIKLSVPHRYDPKNDSCVNEEVKIFNNKLRRRMNPLEM